MTPSNRHYLRERLSGLRDRLLAIGPDPDGQGQVRAEADARRAMLEQRWRRLETEDPDLAIHQLRARTRLTPLDEEILSLAVGCATDPDLAALVAAAQAPIAEVRPTPWLLLRALATSSDERFDALTALTRAGTLARTGLVTWPTHDPALGPLARPFQAAPFAISFLLGDVRIDDRLAFAAALGSSDLTLDQVSLPPDGLSALRTMAALLARPRRFEAPARGFRPPRASLAVLAGSRGTGKSLVARALAGEAGAPLLEVDASALLALSTADAVACLATAIQQATLLQAWVLIDGAERLLRDPPGDLPTGETPSAAGAFRRLLDEHDAVVLITAESPDALGLAIRDRVLLLHELRPHERRQAAYPRPSVAPGAPPTAIRAPTGCTRSARSSWRRGGSETPRARS